MVDDAQRAHTAAVGQRQWRTRIEPEMGRAGDQFVVAEPRIFVRIGDFKYLIVQDGVGTEGQFTGCLRNAIQAGVRLEPLAVGVDQDDQ